MGLVEKGDVWMQMVESRNKSSHTYNKETTDEIVNAIIDDYFAAFRALNEKLNGLAEKSRSEQG